MKSPLELWLDLIKALLWPSVVLIGLYLFRNQISSLIERLAKLKIGDTEAEFQRPASEPIDAPNEVKKELEIIGPGGFLTEEGIRNVISSLGLLSNGETFVGQVLIFSTAKQRTWLVASTRSLFCVLDDERTRTSGRIVQWVQPIESIDVVHAREYKPTAGLLQVGKRKDWLYSTALFPEPSFLEGRIKDLLNMNK